MGRCAEKVNRRSRFQKHSAPIQTRSKHGHRHRSIELTARIQPFSGRDENDADDVFPYRWIFTKNFDSATPSDCATFVIRFKFAWCNRKSPTLSGLRPLRSSSSTITLGSLRVACKIMERPSMKSGVSRWSCKRLGVIAIGMQHGIDDARQALIGTDDDAAPSPNIIAVSRWSGLKGTTRDIISSYHREYSRM